MNFLSYIKHLNTGLLQKRLSNIGKSFLVGSWELNPVYTNPNRAYDRHTPARYSFYLLNFLVILGCYSNRKLIVIYS